MEERLTRKTGVIINIIKQNQADLGFDEMISFCYTLVITAFLYNLTY